MQTMPHDWLGLMMVVFILGMKHGIDPDHLATIDGLTRFNAQSRPRVSRWAGILFSLGHGIVVTIVAALVAMTATEWSAPQWLEQLGSGISILFLLLLGIANLAGVLRAAPDQIVRPIGLKGRFLRRFSETSHPVLIAAVGAAFALSFDTISQTAIFSLTASNLAGCIFSIGLGLLFMIGMMVTDGINGFWVARLLRRSSQRALIASRVMGLSIGFLSLAIASVGIARYVAPGMAAMLEHASLQIGLVLVAMLLASYAIAMRLSSVPQEI